MGREIRCRVRHDGQEAEAKAQLDTDELIVRSPFRLTVPRAGIRSATVAGTPGISATRAGNVSVKIRDPSTGMATPPRTPARSYAPSNTR
jgi:hypothetical protein